MATRPLLGVTGADGAAHGAHGAMQSERLTCVRHTCLGTMPSLIPFKGVLLPSAPALLVRLYQCLPSVLPLQVTDPFLSAAIPLFSVFFSNPLQIPQKESNNGSPNCLYCYNQAAAERSVWMSSGHLAHAWCYMEGVKKINVIILASQTCLCCGLSPAWRAESFPGTSVSAKSRNVASNTV